MLSINKAAPRRRTPKRRPSDSDLVLLCVIVLVCCAAGELQAQTLPKTAERHSYKIDLKIDFDRLTYTGVERVRWVNRCEKPS